MDKKMVVLFIGLVGGSGLSFLGFGLMWIGLPPYAQALLSLVFLLATYGLARFSEAPRLALGSLLAGAAPLGGLLTQFRDKNDSHLLPVTLVSLWLLGSVAGALLARRR